jgi:ATPase subunit of ABC transporter with duplicated ATPase domains
MSPQLSAIDLGYQQPDGSILFSSLTFSFGFKRTGIVGVNGVGKSTLLDLLVGRRSPASGLILRDGEIVYLAQQLAFNPSTTVAETIGCLHQLQAWQKIEKGEGTEADFDLLDSQWDLFEQIEKSFARLGVDHLALTQRVDALSDGELMRVRLAEALLRQPDYLLLDEPTNHLDVEARHFIHELVATWKGGLLVVSHDRTLLNLVDEIAELDETGLTFYGGNYEFYHHQRDVERAAAEAAYSGAKSRLKSAESIAQRAREKQMKRQSAGAKVGVKANLPAIVAGARKRQSELTAARLGDRHEAKISSLQAVVQAARDRVTTERRITIDLDSSPPADRRLVEMAGVNYRYEAAGGMLWSTPIDLEIIGHERIHLCGKNGAGKSTFIDLICGRKSPTIGELMVKTRRIGLLDQRVTVLDPDLTLIENLKCHAPTCPAHELRTLLGRFLFAQETALKKAGNLSGGERVRAGLACLLSAEQAPELLILDEPTNNLDLTSLEELTRVLQAYRGALLVVSHDQIFVEEIELTKRLDLSAQSEPRR